MADSLTSNRRTLMAMAAGATVFASAMPASGGPAKRTRRTIEVGSTTLGSGAPKTIVSITASDRASALDRAAALHVNSAVDLVELRVDHLRDALNAEQVGRTAALVRAAIGSKPLIVTFRTKREGGHTATGNTVYAAVYDAVLAAQGADIIDLEIARIGAAPAVAAVLHRARAAGTPTIGSSHNFDQTPSVEQMVAILARAQALGTDISKIAVMPHDPGDVLRLLEATWRFVRDIALGPVITMSMGTLGGISRLAGTTFGSDATFGADGDASAPGQIPVSPLYATLHSLNGEGK